MQTASLLRTLVVFTTAATLLGGVFLPTLGAQDAPKGEGKDKAKRDTYPFNGKVKATDKAAQTLTLDGKEKPRVIQLTPETKYVKQGKPAVLDDLTAGEQVGGLVKKTPDGKEQAVSVRIGPAPEKQGEAKKKKE